jgi:hypothetical protein
LQRTQIDGERRDWKGCANRRDAYALRASGAGRVNEVNGVNTIATASLGEVDDVVEDGQAAKVVVLADLVGFVTELGDGNAGERRGRFGCLEAFGSGRRLDELCACAQNNAVRLRVRAITCVACGVEEVLAITVVEDCGAAVIATIGVGLGEGELAIAADGGNSAVEVDADRIGGIDRARGIGVRDVDGVDRGDVAHAERERGEYF